MVKDVKIEQAVDCVSLMKELLRGCCEKLQGLEKIDRGENAGDSVNDYEELLQKAEAKIRVFIRVRERKKERNITVMFRMNRSSDLTLIFLLRNARIVIKFYKRSKKNSKLQKNLKR